MSGVFKAVGKVFKKVVKVVKKVAPYALAIGAVVLTGGAALGALPAVGSIGASLGLSAGLSSVLGTAITGAAIGTGAAALTGQNIGTGAMMGFAGGALTGGVGALGGIGGGVAGGGSGALSTAAGAAANPGSFASLSSQILQPAAGIGGAAVSAGVPAAAAAFAPTAAGAGGGILGGIGRFATQNPAIVGQLISGVGGGLAQGQAVKDANKARDKEVARIEANYGDTSGIWRRGGIGGQAAPEDPNLQNPNERFSAAAYGRGQWTYDPTTGKIVPVPQAKAA